MYFLISGCSRYARRMQGTYVPLDPGRWKIPESSSAFQQKQSSGGAKAVRDVSSSLRAGVQTSSEEATAQNWVNEARSMEEVTEPNA